MISKETKYKEYQLKLDLLSVNCFKTRLILFIVE